jgi:enterochelin esterase-like enzyme
MRNPFGTSMSGYVTGDPVLPNDITTRARELGPLESPVIWWTLAGWTVVLVTIAVLFWQRRKTRHWATAGAALCLLLTAVTAVNTYVGYVRTPADLGRLMQRGSGVINAAGLLLSGNEPVANDDAPSTNPKRGTPKTGPVDHPADSRIESVSIPDPANKVPSGQNFVILPPGYYDPANANRHYPVVYLIHGYPFGGPNDWLTSGDAPGTLRALEGDKLISPMIVVSVDMTAGVPSEDWECLNIPGGPQLENYLADTVVHTIDQRFRTVADRSGRALGGMSGGGFGALNIGLHHVNEFGTLVIALPYDDLNDSVGVLHGNQPVIRANTPRQYIPTMSFPQKISVMLAVGTGAPTDVSTAHRIGTSLEKRGQEVVVHAEHGFNHTWHTARATLPYLLVFADQHFHAPGSPAGPASAP